MQIVKRSDFVQKLLKWRDQFTGFLFVSVSYANFSNAYLLEKYTKSTKQLHKYKENYQFYYYRGAENCQEFNHIVAAPHPCRHHVLFCKIKVRRLTRLTPYGAPDCFQRNVCCYFLCIIIKFVYFGISSIMRRLCDFEVTDVAQTWLELSIKITHM